LEPVKFDLQDLLLLNFYVVGFCERRRILPWRVILSFGHTISFPFPLIREGAAEGARADCDPEMTAKDHDEYDFLFKGKYQRLRVFLNKNKKI
jgi:hypothetical protein